jgi:hypothetical protein
MVTLPLCRTCSNTLQKHSEFRFYLNYSPSYGASGSWIAILKNGVAAYVSDRSTLLVCNVFLQSHETTEFKFLLTLLQAKYGNVADFRHFFKLYFRSRDKGTALTQRCIHFPLQCNKPHPNRSHRSRVIAV